MSNVQDQHRGNGRHLHRHNSKGPAHLALGKQVETLLWLGDLWSRVIGRTHRPLAFRYRWRKRSSRDLSDVAGSDDITTHSLGSWFIVQVLATASTTVKTLLWSFTCGCRPV